jgi:hypothetical protein
MLEVLNVLEMLLRTWLWPGVSAIFAVLATFTIYRLALAVFRHFS